MSKPEKLSIGIDAEHLTETSDRLTRFLNIAPTSFDLTIPRAQQENNLNPGLKDLGGFGEDDYDFSIPGQETLYARGGGPRRISVRRPRGVGKKFSSRDARRSAVKESLQAQGFGAKGFFKDALFVLPAYALGFGALTKMAAVSAATAEVGAVLSFLGVEAVSVMALLGLALIQGVGGAAFWALHKMIKGLPGRFAAKIAPVWTTRVTDSIAAGWIFLDKLAYQMAQSGVHDTGWKKLGKGALAFPAFAYMAYRFANTTVSGILDVAFSLLTDGEGWTKMYRGAAGLGNMALGIVRKGQPEVHFNALIREDENDINPTNIPLRIGNAVIKGTRDPRLDVDELDRDGEIGEPDGAAPQAA